MATYRIFCSNDGGKTYELCEVSGNFHDEEAAHNAADLLSRILPGMYEVVKSARGRPKGSKDAKPRIRRTSDQLKNELMNKIFPKVEASVPETEVVEEEEEHFVDTYVDSPVDSSNGVAYNEPSEEEFESMMQDIEEDRNN